ncbi:hypothetical protein, partial [Piscirickettsia salmonis]|uniref:hypothetical protein n=1 Tax=Piscirickettsia salmonis TaxID=1238 RepID=UPI00050A205D
VFRNSALLKTRTYLGLLTPCLALHGSQRWSYALFKKKSEGKKGLFNQASRKQDNENKKLFSKPGDGTQMLMYLSHLKKQQELGQPSSPSLDDLNQLLN